MANSLQFLSLRHLSCLLVNWSGGFGEGLDLGRTYGGDSPFLGISGKGTGCVGSIAKIASSLIMIGLGLEESGPIISFFREGGANLAFLLIPALPWPNLGFFSIISHTIGCGHFPVFYKDPIPSLFHVPQAIAHHSL